MISVSHVLGQIQIKSGFKQAACHTQTIQGYMRGFCDGLDGRGSADVLSPQGMGKSGKGARITGSMVEVHCCCIQIWYRWKGQNHVEACPHRPLFYAQRCCLRRVRGSF